MHIAPFIRADGSLLSTSFLTTHSPPLLTRAHHLPLPDLAVRALFLPGFFLTGDSCAATDEVSVAPPFCGGLIPSALLPSHSRSSCSSLRMLDLEQILTHFSLLFLCF
jgi:hypothetical protein